MPCGLAYLYNRRLYQVNRHLQFEYRSDRTIHRVILSSTHFATIHHIFKGKLVLDARSAPLFATISNNNGG